MPCLLLDKDHLDQSVPCRLPAEDQSVTASISELPPPVGVRDDLALRIILEKAVAPSINLEIVC